MAVQTVAERPFAIGDLIEWDGDDGSKHTGQVRSMGDPGVTTDRAWLPWNTKGLRKVESEPTAMMTDEIIRDACSIIEGMERECEQLAVEGATDSMILSLLGERWIGNPGSSHPRPGWHTQGGTKPTLSLGLSRADKGITLKGAQLASAVRAVFGIPMPKERAQSDFTRVNSDEAPEPTGYRLLNLPVGQVQPSPQNPRSKLDEDALGSLANDIRINGQINPITVRELGAGSYEVITGERRLRACWLAAMPTILAINRGPISLEEALVERVRENAQREQLTPLEEAKAIDFLLGAGKSAAETATIMGKSEAWVSLTRNLGRMPGEVQELLAKGKLSRTVAEALMPLMLWPKVLVEYARMAASNGWASRTTASEVNAKVEMIRREEERQRNPPKRTETQPAGIDFEEDETTDIPAGERTAQEALANEPEAPKDFTRVKTQPELSPEEIAAAQAKQQLRKSLQQRFTDLSDVLWTCICAAIEAGTDCVLLTEIEALVKQHTGDPFAEDEEASEDQTPEIEFTVADADEDE